MVYYCSTADVADRMGLSSQERIAAASRITGAIRRACIDIDQEFFSRGRDEPSKAIAENSLSATISAAATTISLNDASSFSSAGFGNVDGDTFQWTGKSTNDLTGVTGISFDHAAGVIVQEGELAHIIREICADLAAGYIYEDQAVFGDGKDLRANTFRKRGTESLNRIAHHGGIN